MKHNRIKIVLMAVMTLSVLLLLCSCSSDNAKSTESLIKAIGVVNYDSLDAILSARDSFDALTGEEKDSIKNYQILIDAENKYVALMKDANGIKDYIGKNEVCNYLDIVERIQAHFLKSNNDEKEPGAIDGCVNDIVTNAYDISKGYSVGYESFSQGFYDAYPYAEPNEIEETVTGRFNDPVDSSIFTSSGTSVSKVRHYGDFAIEDARLCSYDEGEYGWKNGVFIDVPAHFDHNDYAALWYKGIKIISDLASEKSAASTEYELPKENGEFQFIFDDSALKNAISSKNREAITESLHAVIVVTNDYIYSINDNVDSENNLKMVINKYDISKADADVTSHSEETYEAACALLADGKYDEAIVGYAKILGYKDSEEKIKECKYQTIISMWDSEGQNLSADEIYQAAQKTYDYFMEIKGYNDVVDDTLSRMKRVVIGTDKTEENVYYYNEFGSLISDANYVYEYDSEGKLVKRTYLRDGSIYEYSYSNGLLSEITDPKGKVKFKIDSFGRVVSKDYGSGIYTYRYDEDGRLVEIDGPEGVYGHDKTTFEYNDMGCLIIENQDLVYGKDMGEPGKIVPTYTLEYSYDDNGDLVSSKKTNKKGTVTVETVNYRSAWIITSATPATATIINPFVPSALK